MNVDRFLPVQVAPDRITHRIGLISDTHMPSRCRSFPANLHRVLDGVDLLLHAGDVGELWVLDQLSNIAPVIAVHGNDDSADAQRELPFQQIITVAGKRLLLWHSHFPDWQAEMAFRQEDDLDRSIQRSVDQGRRAGADVVIFGHWHIPLVFNARDLDTDDLLVINPGAIASGNVFTRMVHQTVALLWHEIGGHWHVAHIDLAHPDRPFVSPINWDAGFTAAGKHFAAPIVPPDILRAIPFLQKRLSHQDLLHLGPVLAELAFPIWEGEDRLLATDEIDHALRHASTLPPPVYARIIDAWDAWQAQPAPPPP
jgi:putative phosphoesterase